MGKFQSIQINKNKEETLYDYQPRLNSMEKKEYLRKGSSINKSILNNIVRLKLNRVQESNKPAE